MTVDAACQGPNQENRDQGQYCDNVYHEQYTQHIDDYDEKILDSFVETSDDLLNVQFSLEVRNTHSLCTTKKSLRGYLLG